MYQPQGCAYTLKTYDIDVMDEFAYYPPSIEIYPTVKLADSTYKNEFARWNPYKMKKRYLETAA